MHFTTKEPRIVIMGYEEDVTDQLDMRADYSVNVLSFWKMYQELGEKKFYLDLCDFLCLNIASFRESKDRKRLRGVIVSIEHHIETYSQRRDQVNGAICEIDRHPERDINSFARNLYVNILRGKRFHLGV